MKVNKIDSLDALTNPVMEETRISDVPKSHYQCLSVQPDVGKSLSRTFMRMIIMLAVTVIASQNVTNIVTVLGLSHLVAVDIQHFLGNFLEMLSKLFTIGVVSLFPLVLFRHYQNKHRSAPIKRRRARYQATTNDYEGIESYKPYHGHVSEDPSSISLDARMGHYD